MERVLLLNASYEPLRVITWKRAVTLLTLGKVEVLETYEREVRSVTLTLRLPAVVRLLRLVRFRDHTIRFCRQNIYIRDRYRCQYCGRSFAEEELTYDHVVPRSMGGSTAWDNIVTCCLTCNKRKGGRTPRQAGMRLIRTPKRPSWHPILMISLHIKRTPDSWRAYLFWQQGNS
ncbi:MAG: HNH endonuclease [Deltaproteobacteria bacterium]|nr:HNH endonuclease [Deltaproteobacteria bacterium]MBW2071962.1 HNH endonuclease [Deltaproteobacteria bacterium]